MGEEKSDTEGGRTEDHEDDEDAKPTAEEGEGSPLWPRGSGGQEKRVGRGEAEGLSSRRRLEIARSLVVSSAAHANIGRGLSGLHFSWHASARSNPNLSPTPPLAAAPSEFLLDLSNDPAKRFSGVAQETVQNMAKRTSKTMSISEARMILGVSENTPMEEVLKKYEALFERNAKMGSFYVQSKVQRAKECIEQAQQSEQQEQEHPTG
ncbi:hypothetical protein AXG93_2528s1910 [Marchantia polymorpha subsp. ruderalis]|uniref:Uncharacterized protein n=1 Tax=Marchantia polymorpha subsp. ruderalis TaxID=1480154 RepID=A0A176WPS0_MARPO|nr:hypothetical protein AXG93_2528s1910 [Marchantia polymorpha subsp. ruderalis]